MAESLYFLQDLALILLSAAACGHLCHRLNLSPVVGYLVAGLILGTPQITFPYVTDEARVNVIGQLGLVFLMFGIGLQLQFRKLKEMGAGVVLAAALTALMVLTVVRVAADLWGLSEGAGLCLAAVFMVSSSAVIGKVLQERGLGHFRFGRLALGMTLLEDIVAVVMLAVLGAYLAMEAGGDGGMGLPMTLARLAGFAVLVLVLGILLVPRLLGGLERRRQPELASILVAALLLTLAVLAVRAGYSPALGAFLFGLVVAESRQRPSIERNFQGLKDVFLTVFFVTIGMLIEVSAIPEALPWILLGTAGALFGRAGAAFMALLLSGERPRTAFESAICVTPVGEFSFVIAGLAVAAGVFSETFQVVAVGIALLTSLISPLLMVRAERFSAFLDTPRYKALNRLHAEYVEFLKGVAIRADKHALWNLLRRRIWQIGREVLLISALLLFAEPIRSGIQAATQLPPWSVTVVISTVFGLLCLVMLVAIWRNLSAAAMLVADYLVGDEGSSRKQAAALRLGLHGSSVLLLGLWFWNLLPSDVLRGWGLLIAVALVLGTLLLAWRPMVRWQSQMEIALQGGDNDSGVGLVERGREAGWRLNAREYVLPDETPFGGVPLMEVGLRERFAVSVVGIERGGHSLRTVGPQTHLFPGDRLLLLGTESQFAEAEAFLGRPKNTHDGGPELRELVLETLVVAAESPLCGRALRELNLPRRFGLQVVGLRRGENEELLSPPADTTTVEGDILLLLGTPQQLVQLKRELG